MITDIASARPVLRGGTLGLSESMVWSVSKRAFRWLDILYILDVTGRLPWIGDRDISNTVHVAALKQTKNK